VQRGKSRWVTENDLLLKVAAAEQAEVRYQGRPTESNAFSLFRYDCYGDSRTARLQGWRREVSLVPARVDTTRF
jgi:hypothetical protein